MKNQKYPLIFVVEDNSVYNTLIVNHLHIHKLTNTESFISGEECLKNIHRRPDIIIQDYLLGGINGVDVLVATKKRYPETEFIFLSGQDSIEAAVNCLKYGAYDYIVKDPHALNKMVDKINKLMIHHERIISNKRFAHGITLFIMALVLIILIFAALTIMFPTTFSILGN